MGREKAQDHPDAQAAEQPVKKPYTKPTLQRLGSVSELTQMGSPYGK